MFANMNILKYIKLYKCLHDQLEVPFATFWWCFLGQQKPILKPVPSEAGTRCIPGLMTDDSNIEMNGYRLFRWKKHVGIDQLDDSLPWYLSSRYNYSEKSQCQDSCDVIVIVAIFSDHAVTFLPLAIFIPFPHSNALTDQDHNTIAIAPSVANGSVSEARWKAWKAVRCVASAKPMEQMQVERFWDLPGFIHDCQHESFGQSELPFALNFWPKILHVTGGWSKATTSSHILITGRKKSRYLYHPGTQTHTGMARCKSTSGNQVQFGLKKTFRFSCS